MTCRRSAAFLLRVVGAVLCMAAFQPTHAQFADGGATRVRVQTDQFTLTGMTEDGKPWKITGSRSRTTGPSMLIDDVEMEFTLPDKATSSSSAGKFVKPDSHGDSRILIRSPHCEYNLLTQEIKSDAPITIVIGSGFKTTGIGYDLDVRKRVILIRSAVAVSLTGIELRNKKRTDTKD